MSKNEDVKISVPLNDIERLERARVELFRWAELHEINPIHFMVLSQVMFKITNTRYKTVAVEGPPREDPECYGD